MLTEKEHLWQSRKPSKRALQLAFYTGVATVSERKGMLKTYELTNRHFGWDKLPKPASAWTSPPICSTARLRAQGVGEPGFGLPSGCAEQDGGGGLIASRVRRGELVPVEIEGAGKQEHWAAPAALEPHEVSPDLVHILSPFDPLIIQRKRTKLFFDYDHCSRPMCRRRSASSAISRCRSWSATRSSPRSISRPTGRRRSC